MHVRLFTAAVTAAALCACVSEADMSAIEQAAASFHQHQAAGEHRANYDAADATFRAALPAADFARINEAIRSADGCSDPMRDPMNYRSSATTSGNFVMVVYNRTCAGGPLVEQFTFKIVGGVPRLSGYYVSGMALFPSGQPSPPPAPNAAAPEDKAPDDETPPPGNRT